MPARRWKAVEGGWRVATLRAIVVGEGKPWRKQEAGVISEDQPQDNEEVVGKGARSEAPRVELTRGVGSGQRSRNLNPAKINRSREQIEIPGVSKDPRSKESRRD